MPFVDFFSMLLDAMFSFDRWRGLSRTLKILHSSIGYNLGHATSCEIGNPT